MSLSKQQSLDDKSEIYPYCLHAKVQDVEKEDQKAMGDKILQKCSVIATTCTNSTGDDLSGLSFNFVIVDEAGQVCLSEVILKMPIMIHHRPASLRQSFH